MSASDQARLIPSDDEDAAGHPYIRVQTCGRTIRPLLAIPSAVVTECRLTYSADGLRTSAVDPSNVAMYELDAPADAFRDYDYGTQTGAENTTVGINLNSLTGAVQDARLGKQTNDDVALYVDPATTQVTIDRDYGATEVSRTTEFLNTDSDSIREQPDLPDLDLDWSVELDVDAFRDTIHHVDTVADDRAVFEERRGKLCVHGGAGHDAVTATEARFDADAEPQRDDAADGAKSAFPLSYLKSIVDALKAAKVETVTVEWGAEFPAYFRFSREDDDGGGTLYDGSYVLAPRIHSDGGGDA